DPLERPIDGIIERLNVVFFVVDRHNNGKKFHDRPTSAWHLHALPLHERKSQLSHQAFMVERNGYGSLNATIVASRTDGSCAYQRCRGDWAMGVPNGPSACRKFL